MASSRPRVLILAILLYIDSLSIFVLLGVLTRIRQWLSSKDERGMGVWRNGRMGTGNRERERGIFEMRKL